MDTLLHRWNHRVPLDSRLPIVPDGCRDLIVQVAPGHGPRWFVSPLDDRTRTVTLQAGTFLQGFRMKPGTHVDPQALLASLRGCEPGSLDVESCIQEQSHLCSSVAEALEALATRDTTVGRVAIQLGVRVRTLQRLVSRETGRPPSFWLQLARVRSAGRAVRGGVALPEVAHDHGFADQSHMTRQFRRFLSVTPARARTVAYLSALTEKGYG